MNKGLLLLWWLNDFKHAVNLWRDIYLCINTYENYDIELGFPDFNVIKEWGTTWISCDSLHAWLRAQSRLKAMVSSLIVRRWVRPQT